MGGVLLMTLLNIKEITITLLIIILLGVVDLRIQAAACFVLLLVVLFIDTGEDKS